MQTTFAFKASIFATLCVASLVLYGAVGTAASLPPPAPAASTPPACVTAPQTTTTPAQYTLPQSTPQSTPPQASSEVPVTEAQATLPQAGAVPSTPAAATPPAATPGQSKAPAPKPAEPRVQPNNNTVVIEGWHYELRGPFLVPAGPARPFPGQFTVEGRVYKKTGALTEPGVFAPTYCLEVTFPEWLETPPTAPSGKDTTIENWSFDGGRGKGTRARGTYEVPGGNGYFERESTRWSSSTSR